MAAKKNAASTAKKRQSKSKTASGSLVSNELRQLFTGSKLKKPAARHKQAQSWYEKTGES
jgi:hypothetical protein